ncbi:hypothetical protein AKJ16_DCAP20688 [Drosera capensis]
MRPPPPTTCSSLAGTFPTTDDIVRGFPRLQLSRKPSSPMDPVDRGLDSLSTVGADSGPKQARRKARQRLGTRTRPGPIATRPSWPDRPDCGSTSRLVILVTSARDLFRWRNLVLVLSWKQKRYSGEIDLTLVANPCQPKQ